MHFSVQPVQRPCDFIVVTPVLSPERLYECDDDSEAASDD